MANAGGPLSALDEIVRLANSMPGTAFGSAGNTSLRHLAARRIELTAAIEALRMPYKGATPAPTDLVGGWPQFTMYPLAAAAPHGKSGSLRLLAVATAVADRDLRERLHKQSATSIASTPVAPAVHVKRQRVRRASAVGASGIKAE